MEALRCLRLGVNVDHVATLRNARGGAFPDPVRGKITASRLNPWSGGAYICTLS